MNVVLPSNGVIGKKYVPYKLPVIGSIKGLNELDPIDFLLKNEFVRLGMSTDVGSLTSWDRDYLFLLGVCSIKENKLTFNVPCSCKKSFSYIFNLDESEVFDLPQGTKLITTLTKDEVVWRFKLVQVKDELKAYDLTLQFLGMFDQTLFDNLIISLILSSDNWNPDYTSIDNFTESIKKIPHSIYITAHAFLIQSFHGIPNVVKADCPNCNTSKTINISITGNLVVFNSAVLMKLYKSVSHLLSYTEFLNLTFIEYNTLYNQITS